MVATEGLRCGFGSGTVGQQDSMLVLALAFYGSWPSGDERLWFCLILGFSD